MVDGFLQAYVGNSSAELHVQKLSRKNGWGKKSASLNDGWSGLGWDKRMKRQLVTQVDKVRPARVCQKVTPASQKAS